jgi:hypothetical protein
MMHISVKTSTLQILPTPHGHHAGNFMRKILLFFQRDFLPALVRTYNAGLSFALLLLFLLLLFLRTQSEYCIIVQFHHAFSILYHCMQPCPAALPGSLARQPCPAALPGSLARQPCPAVRPISTGFDARARLLRSHRTVLKQQVTKLHARAAVLTDLNLFLVQFHHAFTGSLLLFPQFKDVAMLSLVYELISTCERG